MMTESKIKGTRYNITSRIQRNRIRCRYIVYGIYTIEKTIQVLRALLYSSAHLHTCTVLSTKRVEWVVFQSFDIFSVMVHAIETQNIPT